MKRKLLLVILLGICFAIPVAAGKIELVTADYPPYYGSNMKNGGPLTEIVVAAFKKGGYDAKVTYLPFARALMYGKEGKADGLLGIWYSKERAEWFVYSKPLPGNEVVLYKKTGTKPDKYTDYAALKPYRIGTVRGYAYPSGFDEAKLNIQVVNDNLQNLKKLIKNRVDLVLIDRGLAMHLLRTELPDYANAVEAISPPIKILPMYLVMSKQAKDYQKKLTAFDKGLQLLEEEGELQDIMANHGF